MKDRFYILLLRMAACFGIIGVSFGAFGAHFLKSRLELNELDIIKTAVLYLFIHTLAILAVVLLGKNDLSSRFLKSSGLLFVIGIVLFSGSLFLIGTKSLTGITFSFIGILTPMGGLCFILGWLLLFLHAASLKA